MGPVDLLNYGLVVLISRQKYRYGGILWPSRQGPPRTSGLLDTLSMHVFARDRTPGPSSRGLAYPFLHDALVHLASSILLPEALIPSLEWPGPLQGRMGYGRGGATCCSYHIQIERARNPPTHVPKVVGTMSWEGRRRRPIRIWEKRRAAVPPPLTVILA